MEDGSKRIRENLSRDLAQLPRKRSSSSSEAQWRERRPKGPTPRQRARAERVAGPQEPGASVHKPLQGAERKGSGVRGCMAFIVCLIFRDGKNFENCLLMGMKTSSSLCPRGS